MRLMLTAVVTALGLGLTAPTFAQGDAAAGRDKAFTCMGCHGAPGMRNAYPGYHVPKIGGQHAAYIVEALKGYKSGARSHPTMQSHAIPMSEQDMADIAAYFASLSAD